MTRMGTRNDTFPIAMYTRIANVTSWQWARSMNMTDWENIGTDGMYTVMVGDAGYHLRATAMYDDGEGMGKMASEKTMIVTMNASPMFDDRDRHKRSRGEHGGGNGHRRPRDGH